MTTRIGTNHFVSKRAAVNYYATQGYSYFDSVIAVDQKCSEGAIGIGKPPVKTGQKLGIDTVEGRYFIEESA